MNDGKISVKIFFLDTMKVQKSEMPQYIFKDCSLKTNLQLS